MSRPTLRTSRGWSAAVIALFVVARFLVLSHTSEVRHVRCAAHGELIEAANIDAHVFDGLRLVGARPGNGDDHCELAAALHDATTTVSPQITLLANALVALTTHPPLEAVVASTVYHFAPKTSPPDRWVSLT